MPDVTTDTEYKYATATDLGFPEEYLPSPVRYRLLPSQVIESELKSLAAPTALDTGVWAVTFQPCKTESEASEDRYVVEAWEMNGRTWSFAAVFDGHAGPEDSTHAASVLPGQIQTALANLLSATPAPAPSDIASLLRSTIISYDDSLAADVLALLPPGGEASLAQLSDEDIVHLVNDQEHGGKNYAKVIRCMRGTCALVMLLDRDGGNLWIANLGDSQAVLASSPDTNAGADWVAKPLSELHNGGTEAEVARVRVEHPNEADCIIYSRQSNRVLGALAVTRALGDHEFKLPAVYTTRVFLAAEPRIRIRSKISEFIARSHTPPYVSNIADVRYHKVVPGQDRFVILSSDGLHDLYEDKSEGEMLREWVAVLQREEGKVTKENLALAVLRAGIGGENEEKVSRTLTLEMTGRWMDDTTIVVLSLAR